MSVAIAGLGLEYARRSKNDSEKEARHLERIAQMENKITELEIVAGNQSAQLLQLERHLHNIVPASPPSSGSSKKNSSGTGTSETSKKNIATGQAYSIVDTTSFQSPLMQLHISTLFTVPVIQAIDKWNQYKRSFYQQNKWTKSTKD